MLSIFSVPSVRGICIVPVGRGMVFRERLAEQARASTASRLPVRYVSLSFCKHIAISAILAFSVFPLTPTNVPRLV